MRKIGYAASRQAGRQRPPHCPALSLNQLAFLSLCLLSLPLLLLSLSPPIPRCQFLCSPSSNLSPFLPLSQLAICLPPFPVLGYVHMPVCLSPLYGSMHVCFLSLSLLSFSVYLVPLLCVFSLGYLDWEPEDSISSPGTTLTSCMVAATLFHISRPQVLPA